MRRLPDASGILVSAGTLIAATGCALCFPALGALGAAVGLGFLSAYEGVLINTVLPILALVALLPGAYSWWRHRVHRRGLLSVAGPLMVLGALYPFWQYGWSNALFYFGLFWMLVISILDLVKPAGAVQCRTS